MLTQQIESTFLRYLIDQEIAVGQGLPTLQEMSAELGISVGKLREQLEVARQLGIVSVRPRLGIQREPFDFLPLVRQGMLFALGSGEGNFAQFNQLRQALEIGLWREAVTQLTAADFDTLDRIVGRAWEMLYGNPIRVPKSEHRDLHLTVFSRLDNPFVQGLLAAYWEAYEINEQTRFTEYEYWVVVWQYHEQIVAALRAGEIEEGRQLLIEHFSLLRPTPKLAQQGNGSAMAPNTNNLDDGLG